jgi:hypothetical protein
MRGAKNLNVDVHSQDRLSFFKRGGTLRDFGLNVGMVGNAIGENPRSVPPRPQIP